MSAPQDGGVVRFHVKEGNFFTPTKRVTSPTWGPPPPCKQTLNDAVCRLGTILQSIFCVQPGVSIRLTVWKWSGKSRYQGALPLGLENVCRAFSPGGPTDCPGPPRMGYDK